MTVTLQTPVGLFAAYTVDVGGSGDATHRQRAVRVARNEAAGDGYRVLDVASVVPQEDGCWRVELQVQQR